MSCSVVLVIVLHGALEISGHSSSSMIGPVYRRCSTLPSWEGQAPRVKSTAKKKALTRPFGSFRLATTPRPEPVLCRDQHIRQQLEQATFRPGRAAPPTSVVAHERPERVAFPSTIT